MSESPPLTDRPRKMNAEEAIAWLRHANEPDLDGVLDFLVENCQRLAAIRAVMVVYGLSLLDARSKIEKRAFELVYSAEIAASNAWIEQQIDEAKASGKTLEEYALELIAGGPSGLTPWEPTGLVERATVLSEAFGVPFHAAVEAAVSNKGRKP